MAADKTGTGPARVAPVGGDCPPEDQLVALLENSLDSSQATEIRRHAEGCATCSQFLIGFGDTDEATKRLGDGDMTTMRGTASQFVAEFRLLHALGRGAVGEVFLARDTFLDRLVALKFLTSSDLGTTARERFYVEARAVARLQHPNVVTLYRAGEDNGKRYLVSELVRGQSLERLKKPLPWQKAFDIALGLSRGLAAAHERGVLHRDFST